MPSKEAREHQRNVERLRNYKPHPSRTDAVKQWHLESISESDPAVAIIHLSVTASGIIRCKGLGLDPLHAEILLEELDMAKARLTDYLAAHAGQTNVSPLLRKVG